MKLMEHASGDSWLFSNEERMGMKSTIQELERTCHNLTAWERNFLESLMISIESRESWGYWGLPLSTTETTKFLECVARGQGRIRVGYLKLWDPQDPHSLFDGWQC